MAPSSRSSSSRPRRAAAARCGTWTSRTTRPRPGSTTPTARTTTCGRSCARVAKSSRSSGGTGARRASSTGCTTSPWTLGATSTRPRWTPGSARRSSSSRVRSPWRSDGARLTSRPSCQPAATVRHSRHRQGRVCSMIRSRALAAALPGFALVLSVTVLADAADKKVIRLWQTETEPQTLAVLNQTAAEYEKTHPDVSIKIEGLAWGDLEKQVADALREVKDGQVVRWGLTMTGQPLFINIAVGELLKTNGGRLFDADGRPTLGERPVIELLDFYKKLNRVLPPGWTGHGYLDTFANLANGKAAMLYQAYGRGVGYIEKYAPQEIADPDHFAVADKMVGPSGKTPAAQLDCEPWMVFKDAKGGNEAVDFLRFFFRDENYIPYLHSVPIHLLPIKKSTYRNPRYADNATIRKWRSWVDMQGKYFRNDWIKPVLVTDWDDMTKPYLLEVMGSGILVDMVLDSVKGMPSAEAAARAQKRVEELLASSGYLKK